MTTERVSAVRAAGGAAPVLGLSAATASSVKQAAAAVGLEFVEDLPVSCWVLLKAAPTAEATAAAVKALLAGSGLGGVVPVQLAVKQMTQRGSQIAVQCWTGFCQKYTQYAEPA